MTLKAKYYDGITSISHDAEIELWSDRIYIITASANVEWFYEKAFVVEKANRHADGRIGYNEAPEAQLVFEDRHQFAEVAFRLPVRKRQPLFLQIILYILSVALLVFAIFYLVPSLAPAIGNNMPESWEERLGNFVHNSFTSRFETCDNPEGQAALNKIVTTLGKNSGSKYKFMATVVKTDEMNAFAAPAGRMIILSGLIENADNEAELDGVLAHEIGHAVKRHGVDNLIRTLMTSFIIDVITGGGGSAIYLGKQLLDMDYSRDAEADADKFALQLLAKTNINPQGLHDFFIKVQKEESEGLGKYTKDYDLSFLSSHPATNLRIQKVKLALDPSRQYNNILSLQEWNALKSVCQ